LTGDCMTVLRTLPAESVQVVVTSPPYYQLRDYGVDGQIGLEQTPAEFVAKLVAVFEEVKRVLHPTGLLFVNIGDSYAGSGKGPSNSLPRPASCLNDRQLSAGAPPREWNPIAPGLKAKDLMLIPERFAIAMQDAGWYVRSRIAWCKTSAMPESVRDRPTSAWEHIWMFSKSRTYYYDAEAVRQPLATAPHAPGNRTSPAMTAGPMDRGGKSQWDRDMREPWGNPAGANLRNYWPTKKPVLQLRSDLTPEQRAYVLRRLADGIGQVGHV
jgi:hypothetical protein